MYTCAVYILWDISYTFNRSIRLYNTISFSGSKPLRSCALIAHCLLPTRRTFMQTRTSPFLKFFILKPYKKGEGDDDQSSPFVTNWKLRCGFCFFLGGCRLATDDGEIAGQLQIGELAILTIQWQHCLASESVAVGAG